MSSDRYESPFKCPVCGHVVSIIWDVKQEAQKVPYRDDLAPELRRHITVVEAKCVATETCGLFLREEKFKDSPSWSRGQRDMTGTVRLGLLLLVYKKPNTELPIVHDPDQSDVKWFLEGPFNEQSRYHQMVEETRLLRQGHFPCIRQHREDPKDLAPLGVLVDELEYDGRYPMHVTALREMLAHEAKKAELMRLAKEKNTPEGIFVGSPTIDGQDIPEPASIVTLPKYTPAEGA